MLPPPGPCIIMPSSLKSSSSLMIAREDLHEPNWSNCISLSL
jgi:hypothetical protein